MPAGSYLVRATAVTEEGQQASALALDTDSAAAHNNLGEIHAARGEFEAAVKQLQQALVGLRRPAQSQ